VSTASSCSTSLKPDVHRSSFSRVKAAFGVEVCAGEVHAGVWRENDEDLSVNVKTGVQEVGWQGMDRSGSVSGQMVGSCECGNESSGSIKYGEFLD
jgi:hypothetical protein